MNSVPVVGVVLILFNRPCSRSSENDKATGIAMKRPLKAYRPGTRYSNTLFPISSIITVPNIRLNINVSTIGSNRIIDNGAGDLIRFLYCIFTIAKILLLFIFRLPP